MKNYIVFGILAVVFIIHPSFALASPLTNSQAESLIAVVQSSPETPASAFVNFITVFSNITNTQAESLIGVVQASPNTPANAFVNFLIAFTVDPVESLPVLGALSTQVTNLTNQIKIMSDVKTPVVVPVVDKSDILVEVYYNGVGKDPANNIPFGQWAWDIQVLDNEGNYIKGASVTASFPSDNLYGEQAIETTKNVRNVDSKKWFAGFSYLPKTIGTKTITFTSGSLSKSVTVEVK